VLPPDPPPTVWPEPPGGPPGGQAGSPSHPINLPPESSGGTEPGFWAMGFFPEQGGWLWVWVPIGGPQPPVAQPKK
jgi:hypothetical protein